MSGLAVYMRAPAPRPSHAIANSGVKKGSMNGWLLNVLSLDWEYDSSTLIFFFSKGGFWKRNEWL